MSFFSPPSSLPLEGSVLLGGAPPKAFPLGGSRYCLTRRWRVRPADRPTRRETGGAAKPRRMRGPSSPVPPAGGVPIPRRRQPPPTHCGASRRNGRDLIIATQPAHQPLPSLLSAAAAQAVQAIPRTDNVPRRSNSAKPAPPNLHLPAPRQGILKP